MKLVSVFFHLLVAAYSAAACYQYAVTSAVLNIFNEIVNEVKIIEKDVVQIVEEMM